jgi:hypothetical protein
MTDLMEMAAAALQSGDRKKATRLFGQVLAADPENILAWLSLAQAVDSPERKRECYQRVLRLDPTNRTAQISLSRLVSDASPHSVVTPLPAAAVEIPPAMVEEPAPIPAVEPPPAEMLITPAPVPPAPALPQAAPFLVEQSPARPARPAGRKPAAQAAPRKRIPVWWFVGLLFIVLIGVLAALYLTGNLELPFVSRPADQLAGRWELEGKPQEWLEFNAEGKVIMHLSGEKNTFAYQATPNGQMVLLDENQKPYSLGYKLEGDKLTFGDMIYTRAGSVTEINRPASYASLPPGLTPGEWDIPVLGAISDDQNARLYLFADGTSYIHTAEPTRLLQPDTIQVCDSSANPEIGYCMNITVYGGGEDYATVSMRIEYLKKDKPMQVAADLDMGQNVRDTSTGDLAQDLPGRWLVSGSKTEYEFKPGGAVDEYNDGALATNTYALSAGVLVLNSQPNVAYTLHSLGSVMLLVPTDPNLPARLLIKK